MKLFIILVIVFITSLATAPATASVQNQKFKNCSALQKVYEGGVAKNKKATNRNSKGQLQESNYSPFISKKIYNMNKRLDRDKDKIACER